MGVFSLQIYTGRLNEEDVNNLSSLMFDELCHGKSHIRIQGDSW